MGPALAPKALARGPRRSRPGGAAPSPYLHPSDPARACADRHARHHAGDGDELRALARPRADVSCRRAGCLRVAAHLAQSRRHRGLAARRRRGLRRIGDDLYPVARQFGRGTARYRRRAPIGRRGNDRSARGRDPPGAGDRDRAPARPGASRPHYAVDRLSAGLMARLGVRAFSARRHRLSGAGIAAAAAATSASRVSTCAAARAPPTPSSPACATTIPATRSTASPGKPSPAAPAGTRSNSKARAAAARWNCIGPRCHLAWAREARLARLSAWILAAEREARSFGLKLPGTDLPPGSGAGHRRAALTALALFPAERGA